MRQAQQVLTYIRAAPAALLIVTSSVVLSLKRGKKLAKEGSRWRKMVKPPAMATVAVKLH
jgi:hypothetical protein